MSGLVRFDAMAPMFESEVVSRVEEVLADWRHRVTLEPTKIPDRKLWQSDPASLIRGLKYKPDILIEHDEKMVIVEAKTHPVLLGGIIQARQYSEYFDMPVILCLPDEVVDQVPESVREFAWEQSVHICSLSDLGKVVVDILGDPPATPGQVVYDSID